MNDTQEKNISNYCGYESIISNVEVIPNNLKEVTVFLVREEGLGHLDNIKKCIFNEGFDHILEGEVLLDNIETVAAGMPSENWGKGAWMKSGGLVAYYFVTFDSKPLIFNVEKMKKHVKFYKDRIWLAQQRIRELVSAGKSPSEQCNPLHKVYHGAQAIDWLKLMVPDALEYIDQETKRKYDSFVTPFHVIEDISNHARRAKVEIIDFYGRKAICKTFKEGRERYLKREVLAREVGEELPEVSNILEVGNNYIIMEFCDSRLENITTLHPLFHTNGFLPVWAIKKMKKIILHYRSLGYECIDLSPQNILFDSKNGLKVIDFEFFQKVDKPSRTLKGNYAWYAVPSDFEGDLPVGVSGPLYRTRWISYTGLPLFFCVNDFPEYILHSVRFLAYFYVSLKNLGRRIFSLFPLY